MADDASPVDVDPRAVARHVLDLEIAGLEALRDALSDDFAAVVDRVRAARGRTVLAGVGKSGHVARKIAATLASTGTPAQYVHPTEASHGDLGMITRDDVVIALSKSGETSELADLLGYCRRFETPLVAMTVKPQSMLARAADHVLLVPDAPEACGETRAPTTSTTMMMALGDALAVALLESRGFKAADFKVFHPGGALGAALAKASDVMHVGEALPLVAADAPMGEVLITMSQKGFGCAGVVDGTGALIGVITDGDLRRNMGADLIAARADAVMTADPRTIGAEAPAADALRLMTARAPKVTVLFVTEADQPVGLIHVHDLLRAGVS